jgi:hypothetical protein
VKKRGYGPSRQIWYRGISAVTVEKIKILG